MTRGTFVLIDDNKIYQSIEFNGDMYLSGHGKDALEIIKGDLNKDNFSEAIYTFNELHHDYKDVKEFIFSDDIKNFIDEDLILDFNVDYFNRFFSDYLYIKSNQNITIKTRGDGDEVKTLEIKAGGYIVLNFGHFMEIEEYEEEKDLFPVMDKVEEVETEPKLKYFNVSVSGEFIEIEAYDEDDAIETIKNLIGDNGECLCYDVREQ